MLGVATEATPEATLEAVTLEVKLEATLEVCSALAMQVTEAAQSGMVEVEAVIKEAGVEGGSMAEAVAPAASQEEWLVVLPEMEAASLVACSALAATSMASVAVPPGVLMEAPMEGLLEGVTALATAAAMAAARREVEEGKLASP